MNAMRPSYPYTPEGSIEYRVLRNPPGRSEWFVLMQTDKLDQALDAYYAEPWPARIEGCAWGCVLDAEVATILGVEPEVDVPVVTVATLRAVEHSGVARQEPDTLRNPPSYLRMFARKLRRSVLKPHGRIVP